VAKQSLKEKADPVGSIEIDPANNILAIARENGISWIDAFRSVRSNEITLWVCFHEIFPPSGISIKAYVHYEVSDLEFFEALDKQNKPSKRSSFKIPAKNVDAIQEEISRIWERSFSEKAPPRSSSNEPNGSIEEINGNFLAITGRGYGSFAISTDDFTRLVPNRKCHLSKSKLAALKNRCDMEIKQLAWKCWEKQLDVYFKFAMTRDKEAFWKVTADHLKATLDCDSDVLIGVTGVTNYKIGELWINDEDVALIHPETQDKSFQNSLAEKAKTGVPILPIVVDVEARSVTAANGKTYLLTVSQLACISILAARYLDFRSGNVRTPSMHQSAISEAMGRASGSTRVDDLFRSMPAQKAFKALIEHTGKGTYALKSEHNERNFR
jgi:hypothetical protein